MNQSTPAQQFASDSTSSGSSWRLLLFMLVVFSTLFLSYFGLNIGYRAFLNSSIEQLDKDIEISRSNLNITERDDLIKFYSQIANLKEALRSHVFGSRIFDFLERTTNTNVAYTTVSLGIQERLITIDGIASTYDALVQQLTLWQDHSDIEKMILDDNSIVNNIVRFRVNITFRPNFFILSEATEQTEPIVEDPSTNQEE